MTAVSGSNVEGGEESPTNYYKKMNIYHRQNSSLDGDNNDPMPSTLSLLQVPAAEIPYKKGQLYKRGATQISKSEKLRNFVFKHHSLYWYKDAAKEQYPVNRIKFSPGLDIKMKRESKCELRLQTSRKNYILRATDDKDMDEWFDLFKNAMQGEKETLGSPNSNIGDSKLDFLSGLLEGGGEEEEETENEHSDSEEDYFDCHIYEFSYGFLRDVIYEQMLQTQKQQLHNQANKYIAQLVSKVHDNHLAFLGERHQELGTEKDPPRKKEEELFTSHSSLKRKRQSKYMPNMYIQDLTPKHTTS